MLEWAFESHLPLDIQINNDRKLAHRHQVLFSLNKQSLLYYRANPDSPLREPLVLIPSIINRAYILDLTKNFSMVQFLTDLGHPVYLVDWGVPSVEDQHISFDDFVARHLDRHITYAMKHANQESIGILGYCMGGTLATIYTCLYQEKVRWLVNLLAPIDFSKAGLLADWTSKDIFNADLLIEAHGNMDPNLMQLSFQLMRPLANLSKSVKQFFHPTPADSKEFFDRLEEWAWDNIPFPGSTYTKYIKALYQNNGLINESLEIYGQPILIKNINCPTLVFSADHDHIVPVESANALGEYMSSGLYHQKTIRGGHVAAVVGPRSRKELLPYLAEWVNSQ